MLSAPGCLKGTHHIVFSSTKSVFPHKSWPTSSVTHVYVNKKQGLIPMVLSSSIPPPLRHCISPFLLSNTCWRWGFASVATFPTSMSHSYLSGISATVCQSLQPGFNWFSTRLLDNLSEIRIWSCHRSTGNTSMVSHPHEIKTLLPLLSFPTLLTLDLGGEVLEPTHFLRALGLWTCCCFGLGCPLPSSPSEHLCSLQVLAQALPLQGGLTWLAPLSNSMSVTSPCMPPHSSSLWFILHHCPNSGFHLILWLFD